MSSDRVDKGCHRTNSKVGEYLTRSSAVAPLCGSQPFLSRTSDAGGYKRKQKETEQDDKSAWSFADAEEKTDDRAGECARAACTAQ